MNMEEKKEALYLIISDAYDLLKALREECNHPVGVYQYKSCDTSTGETEYWKDMLCKDCGDHWTVDSVDENGVRIDEYYTNPTDQWVRKE